MLSIAIQPLYPTPCFQTISESKTRTNVERSEKTVLLLLGSVCCFKN
ncbi:hypothetical protein OIU77_027584, partial [Salix suchowensis]